MPVHWRSTGSSLPSPSQRSFSSQRSGPLGHTHLPIFMIIDGGTEMCCWQPGMQSRWQPHPPDRQGSALRLSSSQRHLSRAGAFGAGAPNCLSEAEPLLPTRQREQRLALEVKAQTTVFKRLANWPHDPPSRVKGHTHGNNAGTGEEKPFILSPALASY